MYSSSSEVVGDAESGESGGESSKGFDAPGDSSPWRVVIGNTPWG